MRIIRTLFLSKTLISGKNVQDLKSWKRKYYCYVRSLKLMIAMCMGCYVLVVLVVPSTVIAFRCAASSIVGHNRYSVSRSHRTMERYRLRRDDDNDYSPSTDNEFDDEFDKRFAILESRKKSPIFSGKGKWQIINKAILAGMFIAGIGTGYLYDAILAPLATE